MADYKLDITRFDEGISDDPREPILERNAASLIKHFDCFSNPYKLTPYRSTEADHADASGATGAKQYDIYHFQLSSAGLLWGLGKNASGYPKVLRKADPTTGNWLASDGSAAATAIGEGNAARITGCFIEWQGSFYFFQGTNQLARVAIATGVITNSVITVGSTITTVAQGVYGMDGNLYLFYNNKVVKVNSTGTATDDVAMPLPSDSRITSCDNSGKYLAIGMSFGTSATAIPFGRAKVYMWDFDSTTKPADVIDFGEGSLNVLGNIEGVLIGVSDRALSSTLGLTRGAMVVRAWTGGEQASVVKEMVANQTVSTTTQRRFLNEKVIKNNKIYWVASVPFGASTSTETTHHIGIWSFGRKNIGAEYALSLDFIEEGLDSSNYFIRSFGAAGEYWFINHSADGSISKTDDAANYTFTSIYETQVWNPDGQSVKKLLKGVSVDFEPFPSGGTITVKYKKDEETSFTTLSPATAAAENDLFTVLIKDSNGNTLPEFRKIILRVEVTGAKVEPTRIYAEADKSETEIYG